MIAVIDYGAGNLRSVVNTFRKLGADIFIAEKPEQLADAEKVVLPGVGAFGAGMDALRETGFIDPIHRAVESGKPLIGICLGMQYLFDASEEMGSHAGLGLLAGRVVKFDANSTPRIPHIGWNQLHQQQAHPILANVPDGGYAYFVHSYYVEAGEKSDVLVSTDYGVNFPSVLARDNVVGIQCHPEKSQAVGQQIIKNFMEWKI